MGSRRRLGFGLGVARGQGSLVGFSLAGGRTRHQVCEDIVMCWVGLRAKVKSEFMIR